ncbi:hypothetical protein H4R20_004417 [Coemansia guatemalensis]|uniref:PHD-type domain-containing protein n=1 Tax=Coemansia guatemalensis TaxID=2761395 RepID=A0A9W8LT50_9FUNG|nr:hypothetical protein H4R20_004417 [Coemansia guatemalensis]
MLSTNSVAKPQLGGGLSGYYAPAPAAHCKAATDAGAGTPAVGGQHAYGTHANGAAAASAFALATSATTATAAAAAATMTATTATAAAPLAAMPRGGLAPAQTMGRAGDGSLMVAPRPVAAQQLGPPAWMLEMLLGLTAPSHPRKIINDVFFTPEERHESPQLTPVSDIDDARLRPPAAPSDCLEAMDPSADLALFADLHLPENRPTWGDIEPAVAASPSDRQPSPAATVTDADDRPLLCAKSSVAAAASALSEHVARAKSQQFVCTDSDTASLSGESCVDACLSEQAPVRESLRPTIFEDLSHSGVDWCRYCGTTEGINWRPGPWGKRTLCNKHGCDYKGYGFASKMPRLNLKAFADEALEERIRPVLQTFCQICQQDCSEDSNVLVHCDGCHRAYHQSCHPDGIPASDISLDMPWYCEPSCRDNARRRRIVVELPKCRLPYMCSPRHSQSAATPPHCSHDAAVLRSTSSLSASRIARTRKRKSVSASPGPMHRASGPPVLPTISNSSSRISTPFGSSSSKVRKSSRVARPSFRRLESDYTA